jgi:hypothetical protein
VAFCSDYEWKECSLQSWNLLTKNIFSRSIHKFYFSLKYKMEKQLVDWRLQHYAYNFIAILICIAYKFLMTSFRKSNKITVVLFNWTQNCLLYLYEIGKEKIWKRCIVRKRKVDFLNAFEAISTEFDFSKRFSSFWYSHYSQFPVSWFLLFLCNFSCYLHHFLHSNEFF